MGIGTEFKGKQLWRFIKTFGGAFWTLIFLAAGILLAVFVDFSELGTTEIGCIIFTYIAILIFEIVMIKLFLSGLNDLYYNGKTALIVYENNLQILVKDKKLFKSIFVTVEFEDISDFEVSRTKTLWIYGEYWSGKIHKVKLHNDGDIRFKDNKSNKYFSISIDECVRAAELITTKLDLSQLAKQSTD